MGFDTEDDGNGNPYLFCFVSEDGVYHCDNAEQARGFISSFSERLARDKNLSLELWATNLEYDLVNLFGREKIRDLHFHFGKSNLLGARWKGKRISFKDTFRHVPSGVATLGEMVGLPKLSDNHRGIRYCIRDATITFKTAKLIHKTYSSIGAKVRLTLPGTAYHLWKKSFWKRDIFRPHKEIWDAAKEAYHGGRTEPFAIGEYDNVTVIDAASMFPFCMTQGDFPIPWGPYERIKKRSFTGRFDAMGLYLVDCSSNVSIPSLPFRTSRGTFFPNGSFVGWFCGEEIAYFISQGGKAGFIDGYCFKEKARPFDDYVRQFFSLKQKSRGAMRDVYKLFLNALYGKYGEKGERVSIMDATKFYETWNGETDARIWCGLAIFKVSDMPPQHSNMLWSAIVTARARVHLHKQIRKVIEYGGRPLYCDTDSIIFSGSGPTYQSHTTTPGDFETRGCYKKVLIVGKKEYGLQNVDGTWEIHVKGIPFSERERYLRTGTATFKRPTRIKESSRIGVNANVWREITKERRISYTDRTIAPDGSLIPLIIRQ